MSFSLKAFGSNGSGQLGIGHVEDVSVPTTCLVEDSIFDSEPTKVVAGGNHTLVQCQSGSIYATGNNTDGRCGLQTGLSSYNTFHRVQFQGQNGDLITHFKSCAATWEASVFAAIDNEIYTCGTGHKGELGCSKSIETSSRPRLLRDFPPKGTYLLQIASCMSHVVALLSDGRVFGWGNGRKIQLGSPAEVVWEPRELLEVGFQVAHVACGRDFTVLFGSHDKGGLKVIGSDKWNIKNLPEFSNTQWSAVFASWGSIFVLLQTGQLVSWGRNDHGQLTFENWPRVHKFAAGSEHAMAIAVPNGRLLAWGWGEHGNCGTRLAETGNVYGFWNEIAIEGPIKMIGAGCATSWVCTSNPEY